ncbi:hypothetical protein RSPO_m00548 (plasmid) [Ralstonia solanacearum Po82]|uniref:Uncharacterized protein n=1 Tax=Ralstonia solanacearum (strain Po82) TaxID=1031711 RepID=F6G7Q8_RALS8|nr:hypothetical protein RSPO_m00548 [Ralstonia solanacearum Po82]
MLGQPLQRCAGFGSSDASKCVSTLPLELAEISPFFEVGKRVSSRFLHRVYGGRVTDQTELKHDVLMPLVSTAPKQFN